MVNQFRDRAYILNEEEPNKREGKMSWVWLPLLAIPFMAFGVLAYFDNSSQTLKSPAGTYSTPSFEEGVGGGPGTEPSPSPSPSPMPVYYPQGPNSGY